MGKMRLLDSHCLHSSFIAASIVGSFTLFVVSVLALPDTLPDGSRLTRTDCAVKIIRKFEKLRTSQPGIKLSLKNMPGKRGEHWHSANDQHNYTAKQYELTAELARIRDNEANYMCRPWEPKALVTPSKMAPVRKIWDGLSSSEEPLVESAVEEEHAAPSYKHDDSTLCPAINPEASEHGVFYFDNPVLLETDRIYASHYLSQLFRVASEFGTKLRMRIGLTRSQIEEVIERYTLWMDGLGTHHSLRLHACEKHRMSKEQCAETFIWGLDSFRSKQLRADIRAAIEPYAAEGVHPPEHVGKTPVEDLHPADRLAHKLREAAQELQRLDGGATYGLHVSEVPKLRMATSNALEALEQTVTEVTLHQLLQMAKRWGIHPLSNVLRASNLLGYEQLYLAHGLARLVLESPGVGSGVDAGSPNGHAVAEGVLPQQETSQQIPGQHSVVVEAAGSLATHAQHEPTGLNGSSVGAGQQSLNGDSKATEPNSPTTAPTLNGEESEAVEVSHPITTTATAPEQPQSRLPPEAAGGFFTTIYKEHAPPLPSTGENGVRNHPEEAPKNGVVTNDSLPPATPTTSLPMAAAAPAATPNGEAAAQEATKRVKRAAADGGDGSAHEKFRERVADALLAYAKRQHASQLEETHPTTTTKEGVPTLNGHHPTTNGATEQHHSPHFGGGDVVQKKLSSIEKPKWQDLPEMAGYIDKVRTTLGIYLVPASPLYAALGWDQLQKEKEKRAQQIETDYEHIVSMAVSAGDVTAPGASKEPTTTEPAHSPQLHHNNHDRGGEQQLADLVSKKQGELVEAVMYSLLYVWRGEPHHAEMAGAALERFMDVEGTAGAEHHPKSHASSSSGKEKEHYTDVGSQARLEVLNSFGLNANGWCHRVVLSHPLYYEKMRAQLAAVVLYIQQQDKMGRKKKTADKTEEHHMFEELHKRYSPYFPIRHHGAWLPAPVLAERDSSWVFKTQQPGQYAYWDSLWGEVGHGSEVAEPHQQAEHDHLNGNNHHQEAPQQNGNTQNHPRSAASSRNSSPRRNGGRKANGDHWEDEDAISRLYQFLLLPEEPHGAAAASASSRCISQGGIHAHPSAAANGGGGAGVANGEVEAFPNLDSFHVPESPVVVFPSGGSASPAGKATIPTAQLQQREDATAVAP